MCSSEAHVLGSLVLSVVVSLRGGGQWVAARLLGIQLLGRSRSLGVQVTSWKDELLYKKASLVSEPLLLPFLTHDHLLSARVLPMT